MKKGSNLQSLKSSCSWHKLRFDAWSPIYLPWYTSPDFVWYYMNMITLWTKNMLNWITLIKVYPISEIREGLSKGWRGRCKRYKRQFFGSNEVVRAGCYLLDAL